MLEKCTPLSYSLEYKFVQFVIMCKYSSKTKILNIAPPTHVYKIIILNNVVPTWFPKPRYVPHLILVPISSKSRESQRYALETTRSDL